MDNFLLQLLTTVITNLSLLDKTKEQLEKKESNGEDDNKDNTIISGLFGESIVQIYLNQ